VQRSPLPHLQQGQYTHDLLGTVPLEAWANMSQLAVHEYVYAPILWVCLDPVYTCWPPHGRRQCIVFPKIVSHWLMYMAAGEWHRQRGTSQCLGASPTTIKLGDVHKARISSRSLPVRPP
jgi:hypothetical protein